MFLFYFDCMAISINFNVIQNKFIPHFIDGDIDRINPIFEPFHWIDYFNMWIRSADYWFRNLEMIRKASVNIEVLEISDKIIKEFYKSDLDHLKNLKANFWILSNLIDKDISSDTISALNQITIILFSCSRKNWSFWKIFGGKMITTKNLNYLYFYFILSSTTKNYCILNKWFSVAENFKII